jgi:hypothetical protein
MQIVGLRRRRRPGEQRGDVFGSQCSNGRSLRF